MSLPCKKSAADFKAFVDTAVPPQGFLSHLDSCKECQAALEGVAQRDRKALEAVAGEIEKDRNPQS